MPDANVGRLKWDEDNKRFYETGVDRGVLYLKSATGYEAGEAWNGLSGVSENPSGAEETELFANNNKYGSLRSAEKYGANIEAYTCPRSFYACNGIKVVNGVYVGQQERSSFGLTYRTLIGNDVSSEAGYKLHIVYGLSCSPSEKTYNTVNDSPEAITLSWEATSTPTNVTVDGETKKTSTIEIDTTTLENGVNNAKLKELEDILYGKDAADNVEGTAPRLPDPDEVIGLFA